MTPGGHQQSSPALLFCCFAEIELQSNAFCVEEETLVDEEGDNGVKLED